MEDAIPVIREKTDEFAVAFGRHYPHFVEEYMLDDADMAIVISGGHSVTCRAAIRMLRERGVVGKFVEFFGPGLPTLGLADRATIGNMSPEFGSTCAIFPVDSETLRYLEFTGRPTELIDLVDAYAREQGLFHTQDSDEPTFSELLELDLGDVEPSIAGPKRPQDRIALAEAKPAFIEALREFSPGAAAELGNHHDEAVAVDISECHARAESEVAIEEDGVLRHVVDEANAQLFRGQLSESCVITARCRKLPPTVASLVVPDDRRCT